MKGFLDLFREFWKNREQIRQIVNIVQMITKHVGNLLDDLRDDGLLNGSNLKK